ncbi:hypothetical protein HHL25_02975 [Rhizobium sp. S-51]|uniref:Uncharacterized protein n=1 Tax=Rhizobium terricola TaxID=2728849 RepID=A0A7Y0ATI0_9HYPH|nr:hypothetical protein [Rhizobium terricola]NML73082.1 hypothetical protein [Rhizobium terricola]
MAIRKRHKERTQYIACVLWLIGYSYTTISKVLNLKRSQVGGIIGRSEYSGRSSMTIADRRAKLSELEAIRFDDGISLDGGILDRVPFEVL